MSARTAALTKNLISVSSLERGKEAARDSQLVGDCWGNDHLFEQRRQQFQMFKARKRTDRRRVADNDHGFTPFEPASSGMPAIERRSCSQCSCVTR